MKAAVALALLVAACTPPAAVSAGRPLAPTHSANRTLTFSINHYDLDVPDAYSVRDTSPGLADFELYAIDNPTSHAELGLYFGNFPHFPTLSWNSAPVTSASGDKTAKEFRYSAARRQLEGLLQFTGLGYAGAPITPFSSVHYFAEDVSDEDGKIFAGIARSIRVARPTLEPRERFERD